MLVDVYNCYKLIQRFRVTGLFAGQYITKLHGTVTGVIYTIVGSALLREQNDAFVMSRCRHFHITGEKGK